MTFRFERLEIPEVILVRAHVIADSRGVFIENYRWSEYAANGIAEPFVQDNFSTSTRGVLRGLHYQLLSNAQAKLVSVLRGEIYDVAVDIRRRSPTYARWVGLRISSGDHTLLYVPVGFAHGFQVLSEEAAVVYKVTREYAPEADRGIAWCDPQLGIDWPIPDAILSDKDSALPVLRDAQNDFTFDEGSR
ncbi:MAG TPA: dTDP-4-dehydrorhamnose 3,5-epimerase [Anaerolineales bacterium]|nr:dTDP-4-dehydrorhamnose 3,5-epimerase [Anaerolineales bacterium]